MKTSVISILVIRMSLLRVSVKSWLAKVKILSVQLSALLKNFYNIMVKMMY